MTSNCLLYDKFKLRYYLFGFSLTLITLGTIAITGVMVFKPRKYSPAWVGREEEKKKQLAKNVREGASG